jgi:hypothetical protein
VTDTWTPPPVGLFRTANRLIGPLLRSPLHPVLSSRLMLLEYTGRRSGRRISVPVGWFPWDDGDVLAMSTRRTWVVNLLDGRPVRLCLRGRWVTATPTVLDDVDRRVDLLAEMERRWGPKRVAGLRLGLPADRPAAPAERATAARRGNFVRFHP